MALAVLKGKVFFILLIGLILTGCGSDTTDEVNESQRDLIPDSFEFTSLDKVARQTQILSNTITVSGFNEPLPISITGGEYKIENRSDFFTSRSGFISAGDSLQLRLTSSDDFDTAKSATITIGNSSATFTVITGQQDLLPANSFQMTDRSDVDPGSRITMLDQVLVSGINDSATINIENGLYQINDQAETSEQGEVTAGDRISVFVDASMVYGGDKSVKLVIGGREESATVSTRLANIVPDDFSFDSVDSADVDSFVTSNMVVMEGLEIASPIAIGNGEYSIDGAPFTSEFGYIYNGQSLRVRLKTSISYSVLNILLLELGGKAFTFSVTTRRAPDQSPDALVFNTVENAQLNEVYVSNSVQVKGIDTATQVSIQNGEYSINGSDFTSQSSTVNNNDLIRIRTTAPDALNTSTISTLLVGDKSATYTVITKSEYDLTPNSFLFNAASNKKLETDVDSEEITVEGIDRPVPIRINNGLYSINGGDFTSVEGQVAEGDKVKLRLTTGRQFGHLHQATVYIGDVSRSFNVTTEAIDQNPDGFVIPAISGVPINTYVVSESRTVSGINAPTKISVVGGEYSINNGDYTDAEGTVENGQSIKLRMASSAEFNKLTSASVTIGTSTSYFQVTTQPKDGIPLSFSFPRVQGAEPLEFIYSEIIEVQGFNIPLNVSVQGWEAEYSIEGGDFTSDAGVISSGQKLQIRFKSSSYFGRTRDVLVTVGPYFTKFYGSTREGEEPDDFSFASKTGLKKRVYAISDTVVLQGFDTLSVVNIEGGEYSINGGEFTDSPSAIESGDSLQVKVLTSNKFNTAASAQVTVGRVTKEFVAKTDFEPFISLNSLKDGNTKIDHINEGTELEARAKCIDDAKSCVEEDTTFSWFVDGIEDAVSHEESYEVEGKFVNRIISLVATPFNKAGDAGTPITTAISRTKVQNIVGNDSAFAALNTDGTVETWGNAHCGGDGNGIRDLVNVTHIAASKCAFAALREDGSIVAWGSNKHGGDIRDFADQLTDVRMVIGSDTMFSVVKNDGTVVSWHDQVISINNPPSPEDVKGITKIVEARNQFAALSTVDGNNKIVSWFSGSDFEPIENAIDLVSSEWGFSAYYKTGPSYWDIEIITWGDTHLPNYHRAHRYPENLVATSKVFANFDGSYIQLWGEGSDEIDTSVPDISSGSYSYIHVNSTDSAFAAVYDMRDATTPEEKGRIVTFGEISSDFPMPEGVFGARKIASTDGAFAAITEDGRVYTWGDQAMGANSSLVQPKLKNVKEIYSTERAFAALTYDGEVITWGDEYFGGSNTVVDFENERFADLAATADPRGSLKVNISAKSYAAISDEGKLFAWGDTLYGGLLPQEFEAYDDVEFVEANVSAFAAYTASGTLLSWGSFERPEIEIIDIDMVGSQPVKAEQFSMEGHVGVESIVSTNHAFAALKNNGSVIAWGNPNYGGDSGDLNLNDVVEVYSNRMAFAAKKRDGSIITWGHPEHGGDSSGVTGLDNVKYVVSTGLAFAALKEDGTVISWGHELFGGSTEVSSQLKNVTSLVASMTGFSALTDEGTVVYWGDSTQDGENNWITQLEAEFDPDGTQVNEYERYSFYFRNLDEGLTNVASIQSSLMGFFAILNTGELKYWGYDYWLLPNYRFKEVIADGSKFLGITTDNRVVYSSTIGLGQIHYYDQSINFDENIEFAKVISDDAGNQDLYYMLGLKSIRLGLESNLKKVRGHYLLDENGKIYDAFDMEPVDPTMPSEYYYHGMTNTIHSGFDLKSSSKAMEVRLN